MKDKNGEVVRSKKAIQAAQRRNLIQVIRDAQCSAAEPIIEKMGIKPTEGDTLTEIQNMVFSLIPASMEAELRLQLVEGRAAPGIWTYVGKGPWVGAGGGGTNLAGGRRFSCCLASILPMRGLTLIAAIPGWYLFDEIRLLSAATGLPHTTTGFPKRIKGWAPEAPR